MPLPTVRPRSVSNYCTLRHGAVHYVIGHHSEPPRGRGSYRCDDRVDAATVDSIIRRYPDGRAGRIQNYFDTHCPYYA